MVKDLLRKIPNRALMQVYVTSGISLLVCCLAGVFRDSIALVVAAYFSALPFLISLRELLRRIGAI
jgi:hypothetical protein